MMGQESAARDRCSPERVSSVLAGTPNGLRRPEPGPLQIVHVDPVRARRRDLERRRADMHAKAQAALLKVALGDYIGMGFAFPYPSQRRAGGRGEWLHLYATERPNGLSTALADVADGRCTCLAERGEHPHTARGCDIEGCGCPWVPPPVTDTEEDTSDA